MKEVNKGAFIVVGMLWCALFIGILFVLMFQNVSIVPGCIYAVIALVLCGFILIMSKLIEVKPCS